MARVLPSVGLPTLLLRIAIVSLLSAAIVGAEERKTLFIDRMGGFEKYVEEAIRETEARVEFIEEREHPDLKVLLGKQFNSVAAEIRYTKQTGRKGESILKAVDVKTGKEIASYSFVPNEDEGSKRRAAHAFAKILHDKLQ